MKIRLSLLVVALLAVGAMKASAQGELTLRLARNFGYSLGDRIQGTFTLNARGPEGLQSVTFYLDGAPMGTVTTAPFDLRFVTDSYALGEHRLQAVGSLPGGRNVRSNEIVVTFTPAEEGFRVGLKIAAPIIGITFLLILLSMLPAMLPNRKLQRLPAGAARNYGIAGGTICRRCGRPYPRGIFAPNMVFGKLTRCPFCGKMQISPAASPAMLAAAEAAEEQDAAQEQAATLSEEEKLRREIDQSRYL